MKNAEDAHFPPRPAPSEEEQSGHGQPPLPGEVERGDAQDTIKWRHAKDGVGSLDFGGHTNTPEGPESADFTNPQTLEEMDADTPQPPSTGGDIVDAVRAEHGGEPESSP